STVKKMGFLGYAYARTGRTEKARQMLQALKQRRSERGLLYTAEISTALGDRDRALDDLDRLYESKDERRVFLLFHPMLEPLHGDRRFQALLRRLNLPPA